MTRNIYTLTNVEIGDIVYLRRDGKIIGAKYQGFVSTYLNSSNKTINKFYRADGVYEELELFCASVCNSKYVFRTIEDARHDIPITWSTKAVNNVFREYFDFIKQFNGLYRETCLIKYKWDGYQPQPVLVNHSKYDLSYDGEWSISLREEPKIKLWDTYEKCVTDNSVEVITF